MLFNSFHFIFMFLPIVLAGYHILGQTNKHILVAGWLVSASLFFYGFWNPAYLVLISCSILVNFFIGRALIKHRLKSILVTGICFNLALIGYFKYANFFADTLNQAALTSISLDPIILPLAISFFTFQQIAFLVDTYRNEAKNYGLLDYSLFVTFFPQLIAGPIVHHKEMMPQFTKNIFNGVKIENLAVGITIFIFGLFKKVCIADTMAGYASPVFTAAEAGVTLTIFEAWGAALAYTFQLYFDFSGYSDMAIGIARMFGIILPINFFSPYKASSIIAFWRRWHITLSRFLRDYIYFPLGGSRKTTPRKHVNIILTMLLGGLWHGAGWTFVLWGLLHGVYLSINHGWNQFVHKRQTNPLPLKLCYIILTFTAVVVAWVLFRAESLDGAIVMYHAMVGGNGISLPMSMESRLSFLSETLPFVNFDGLFHNYVFSDGTNEAIPYLFACLAIVWFSPNIYELLHNQKTALNLEKLDLFKAKILEWRFSHIHAVILAIITVITVFNLVNPSEFLYFQF